MLSWDIFILQKIESFDVDGDEIIYMNSGDWLESLSSLEYLDNKWSIYNHTRTEI